MAGIKSLDQTSAKWKRVTSGAGTEYEEGVKNPRADWATQTMNAEKAYEAGIQNAIANKSFGKGVRTAGTNKWQSNAIAKGPARFQSGVALAQDNYQKGFQPYHDVISNTKLPERGPRGDSRNIQRVAVMADALHKKKLALKGGK